jgi:hypothetical protein
MPISIGELLNSADHHPDPAAGPDTHTQDAAADENVFNETAGTAALEEGIRRSPPGSLAAADSTVDSPVLREKTPTHSTYPSPGFACSGQRHEPVASTSTIPNHKSSSTARMPRLDSRRQETMEKLDPDEQKLLNDTLEFLDASKNVDRPYNDQEQAAWRVARKINSERHKLTGLRTMTDEEFEKLTKQFPLQHDGAILKLMRGTRKAPPPGARRDKIAKLERLPSGDKELVNELKNESDESSVKEPTKYRFRLAVETIAVALADDGKSILGVPDLSASEYKNLRVSFTDSAVKAALTKIRKFGPNKGPEPGPSATAGQTSNEGSTPTPTPPPGPDVPAPQVGPGIVNLLRSQNAVAEVGSAPRQELASAPPRVHDPLYRSTIYHLLEDTGSGRANKRPRVE